MTTYAAQPGILADVPRAGRYLFFSSAIGASAAQLRTALAHGARLVDGDCAVLGLGATTVAAMGGLVPGLRAFPSWLGTAVTLPSTPTGLWCWLRGNDPGDLVLMGQALQHALAPAWRLDRVVDGFRHGQGPNGHGRDLTGYEDGTENPQGDAARAAALVHEAGAGLDGGSFVAVQQWVHDWHAIRALAPQAMDHVIGRRRSDNEELDDAPASAHVQRTAQESFDPQAFVLRRSMPWADATQSGLMFVAFGASLDAFEAQLHRMAGLDDGVTDALFGVSSPITGAYFWCPPLRDGRLDLRVVGL